MIRLCRLFSGLRVLAVFGNFFHDLDIRIYQAVRPALGHQTALLEPNGVVTQVFDLVDVMRGKQDRPSFRLEAVDARKALFPESMVSDSQYLIDQQNLGVGMRRDRKSQPHAHAGAVGAQRRVNFIFKF